MSAVAYRVGDRVTGIQSWVCYIHCDAGRCPARINGRARFARQVARSNGWQVGAAERLLSRAPERNHVKVIWKYPLDLVRPDGWLTASPTVEMPAGAEILTMQLQGRTPTLWARVDPEESDQEVRRFHIFGTGHLLPDLKLEYLGTFQHEGLVFHVFEELAREQNDADT